MWFFLILLVLAVLAGLALLLVAATVAALVVVAVHLFPVLLILVGAWLLFRAFGGPKPRHRHHSARWSPPDAGRRAQPEAPWRAPRRPPAPVPSPAAVPGTSARPGLPVDVQMKADQIRRHVDLLLSHADRFPPFSQDLYIVRQTAAEYLPRTLDAYLAVAGREVTVVGPGGKTALDELRHQLRLLGSKLDEITFNLQQQNVDRLLANRRFLEERFKLSEHQPEVDVPRKETGAA